MRPTITTRFRFVAILVLAIITLWCPKSVGAAGYTGSVGDNINYYDGTLSLSEVDASVPGKHGLDVVIRRSYNSEFYTVRQSAYLSQVKHPNNLEQPEKYRYLGQGWLIGYPYIHLDSVDEMVNEVVRRTYANRAIVGMDGGQSPLFFNTDTSTNARFPLKTTDLALFKGFGIVSDTADTLLLTDGTKWVFGHVAGNDKMLTRIINIYGDVLTVAYYGDTRWIKYVASPTGCKVIFRYGNGRADNSGLITYNTIPPDTARLFELQYLNWNGDTLHVKYRYTSSATQANLRKVIHPTGDSTSFGYSPSDTLYFLSQYRSPFGNSVDWQYGYFNRPLIDTAVSSVWDSANGAVIFNSYLGVVGRRTSIDTLSLEYRLCNNNLRNYEYGIQNVGSETIATENNGPTEQYYFFADELGGFTPSYHTSGTTWKDGTWPTALFQKNIIVGNDTVCEGYDYTYKRNSGSGATAVIGQKRSTYDYIFFHKQAVGDTGYSYTRIGDTTIVDTENVYCPVRMLVHTGVPYYREVPNASATALIPTSEKKWSTTETIYDKAHPNLATLSVYGAREKQSLTDTSDWADSLSFPDYFRCYWRSDLSDCHDSTCPPSPNDTIPFSKDSVLKYTYVPQWNLTLVDSVWHYSQYHGRRAAVIEAYEYYDSTRFYLPKKKTTHLDSQYMDRDSSHVNDTAKMVESYTYDASGNLTRTISSANDTTYFTYDATYGAFPYQVIDSSFGSTGAPAVLGQKYYYPNGLLQYAVGMNGNDTTFFYYDQYNRNIGGRRPLDTDTSLWLSYNVDSNKVTTVSKIAPGLVTTGATYRDKFQNVVKTFLKVSDTLSIIDSSEYNQWGMLTRSSRPRYSNDTTKIWTQISYDAALRRVKTTPPGGGPTDSVRYLDEFTTDYRSPSHRKTRVKTDFVGNTLYSYQGDTTSSDTITSILATASATYNSFGKPLTSTDFTGLSRTHEYDAWGRRVKITDPDIGTQQAYYDRVGRVRFVRRNTNDTCTYFKYDQHGRLIEEGTIFLATGSTLGDTTKVDDRSYPDSTVSSRLVLATYRYDSYSTSQIAADTVGGFGYSLGKMTQVADSSGYTYYYYNLRGRVGLKTTFVKGLSAPQKLRFQYYANDALKRITYPDTSRHTDYSYLQTGQLRGISDLIGQDSVKYQAWGAVNDLTFKNGLRSKYAYDDVSRLTSVANFKGANKYFSRSYNFDNTRGYLAKEFDADTTGSALNDSTRSYQYDALGRLTRAFVKAPNGYANGYKTVLYQYDLNNNIRSRRMSVADTLLYDANTNFNNKMIFGTDTSWVFTKSPGGLVTSLTKYAGCNPGDTIFNGNPTNHRTVFKYDYRNLLTCAVFSKLYESGDGPDSVINLYDANGHKVKQIYRYQIKVQDGGGGVLDGMTPGGGGDGAGDSSGTTDTIGARLPDGGFQTDGSGGGGPPSFHWENREIVRYYIWAGNRVILEMSNPNTVTEINLYALGKQLGRRFFGTGYDSLQVMVSDYQGTLRSEVPFGAGGTPTTLIEYMPYGEVYVQAGPNSTNRQFIDKEADLTRQLDFGPRYYNGVAGHFLAPDPILSAPSAYAYTDGNPIMQSDPTGLEASPYAMAWMKWNAYVNSTDYLAACREAWHQAQGQAEIEWQHEFFLGRMAYSVDPRCFKAPKPVLNGSSQAYSGDGSTGQQWCSTGSAWDEMIPGFDDGRGRTPETSIRNESCDATVNGGDSPRKTAIDNAITSNQAAAAGIEGAGQGILDAAGGVGEGLLRSPGSMRFTNGAYNGNALSLRYYANAWGGGSKAVIRTSTLAKVGSVASKGAFIAGLVLAAADVYAGYTEDGNSFGANTQMALNKSIGGFAGSSVGGEFGATAGAFIGAGFGGIGAVPGAIVGGAVGALIGGFGGSAWFDNQ